MPKPVFKKGTKKTTKKVAKPKKCIACGGTGKNSKGGQCVPCLYRK